MPKANAAAQEKDDEKEKETEAKANAEAEGGEDDGRADIEAQARDMGWRPKSEFKGDPKDFIDAEEFVKRGENIMPILKANLADSQKKNRENSKQIAELRQTLSEVHDMLTASERRGYERAISEIEERQRQAAADGDIKAYDKATRDLKTLKKDIDSETDGGSSADKAAGNQAQQGQGPMWRGKKMTTAQNQVVDEFVERNDWFNSNPVMKAAAISFHTTLEMNNKEQTLEENLEEVEKFIKRAYPDHFRNPRQDDPPSVESGGRPRSGKVAKTYANLPQDAKAACDRACRNIPGMTKDKWLANFDWDGYNKQRGAA